MLLLLLNTNITIQFRFTFCNGGEIISLQIAARRDRWVFAVPSCCPGNVVRPRKNRVPVRPRGDFRSTLIIAEDTEDNP